MQYAVESYTEHPILGNMFCFLEFNIYLCAEDLDMRIIAHRSIVEFYNKHPRSKTALEDWYTKVTKADWNNFADMKASFNSVDNVGNQHYVFNIMGNNYRLVVVVKFQIQMVYIRFIGTHHEYDQIDCKNI